MTYLTQVRLLDTVPELLILLTLESVIFTHSIDILKVGGYPEHPCRAGTELSTKAKWGTWQNIELHRFVRKFVYWVRRLFFLGWHVYFLGWTPLRAPPPPPNTPSSAPTQTKRVPIHSFLKQASICILIKTWNWSIAELWGKNWDTDAHAHVTYQAPITGLHSPTLLLFLQNSTDYLMLAQSCKFGVNCWLLHWLDSPRGLHPSPCASDFWTCSQTPPLNPICSKRVWIDWAWAENSDDVLEIS